jgi:hypothetical protein
MPPKDKKDNQRSKAQDDNLKGKGRPKSGERQRMKISSRVHSQLPTDVPSFLLAKMPVRARVLELLAKQGVSLSGER